jgi:RNA polymerase sigma-70 factor (ECF subfamily)
VRQPRPNPNSSSHFVAPYLGCVRGDQLHEHRLSSDVATAVRSPSLEGARIRTVASPVRRNARAAAGRPAIPARASGPAALPAIPAQGALEARAADDKFKTDLIALIPNLRAFGITLAGRSDGEDLAQEALAKAWTSRAHFQPGTSLKAWCFTILRNHFYSGKRRSWRTQPLEQGVAENLLVANDDPSAREELVDVRNAMQLLPDDQREALILCGAAGLSYDEAAHICACAIGTIKSRVSRARAALEGILANLETGRRERTGVSAGQAFDNIMQQAETLQRRAKAR